VARAKVENGALRIPLPPVEVGIRHALPEPGSVTTQIKVLDQQASARSLKLRLSAPAGSQQTLYLRVNDPKVHMQCDGAEIASNRTLLKVMFSEGNGYVEKAVILSW